VLLATLVLGALGLARLDPGRLPLPWNQPDLTPPARADFGGVAVVHDADTLTIAGRRVRLDGVDAPETRQSCERSGFTWPCGLDATAALQGFLRGQPLRCTDNGRDQYGRVLAHCWLGEQDVGAWLVREGWAVAYRRYSDRYVAQENAARRDGRGLWGGRFEMPEEWRRRNPP
jgi:endonuclease YncB( thermonuclease family)